MRPPGHVVLHEGPTSGTKDVVVVAIDFPIEVRPTPLVVDHVLVLDRVGGPMRVPPLF